MIRGLEELIQAAGLVHTLPLTTLKEARLGIDLGLYLDTLLAAPESAEHYVAALGGSPLALLTHIENDLRTLDKAKVKPVFVLSGIQPATRAAGVTTPKSRAQELHNELGPGERKQAWECYEQGDVDGLYEHLELSKSVQISDLIRSVLRAFRHRNIEFMVAPYLAEAQLVSLERHSKSYVHAIYGCTETLLFDRVDKVIISLDLRAASSSALTNTVAAPVSTFKYISKQEIMSTLRCSEEEFLDTALLLGFRNCPTFPPLLDGTIANPSPRSLASGQMVSLPTVPNPLQALDVVRLHRSGYTVSTAFAEHRGCSKINYLESFCKARCLIKFSLVISAEEGRVLPLPIATPTPPVPAGAANSGGVAPGINGTTPPIAPANGAPILSGNEVPSDLHEIFTHRLPDELYFHVSRGLINPIIPEYLASGSIKESAPLGDFDTEEWANFMRFTITESPQAPRCIALALLADSLNQFWQSRKVYAHYHFDRSGSSGSVLPIDSPATQMLVARVKSWNVNFLFVEEELRRQMSSTIDIALCLGATGRNDLAEQTVTPWQSQDKKGNGLTQNDNPKTTKSATPALATTLEKKDEIVANVIWRFLELRGFLNHEHLHTPFARALHLSIRASRLNDKFQEPLYIALELLRAGVLTDQPYSDTIRSGGPSWGDDDDEDVEQRNIVLKCRRHLLLIMRVLSLVPMSFKPQPWRAPLSRELIQFNNFAKAMIKNLRLLVETIASSMLLKGQTHVKRNRDDYLDISLSLPFLGLTSTGLGIVVKCYLEALLTFTNGPVQGGHEDDADVVEARETVISMLEGTFGNIKDVRGEVARGFRFWAAIMQAIDVLSAERSLSPEQVAQFREANAWLQPMVRL